MICKAMQRQTVSGKITHTWYLPSGVYSLVPVEAFPLIWWVVLLLKVLIIPPIFDQTRLTIEIPISTMCWFGISEDGEVILWIENWRPEKEANELFWEGRAVRRWPLGGAHDLTRLNGRPRVQSSGSAQPLAGMWVSVSFSVKWGGWTAGLLSLSTLGVASKAVDFLFL